MNDEKPGENTQDRALREIAKLGEKLESAVRAAASSKQAQEVHAEVVESVRKIGEQFSKAAEAAKSAADSEHGQAVRAQAQKVLETGKQQGVEAAKVLKSSLASGLRAVAKELADLGNAIEEKH